MGESHSAKWIIHWIFDVKMAVFHTDDEFRNFEIILDPQINGKFKL